MLISDTFLPYVEAKIEYDCFILIFPLGSEKCTQKNSAQLEQNGRRDGKKTADNINQVLIFYGKKLWKIKFKFLEKFPTADFKTLQE